MKRCDLALAIIISFYGIFFGVLPQARCEQLCSGIRTHFNWLRYVIWLKAELNSGTLTQWHQSPRAQTHRPRYKERHLALDKNPDKMVVRSSYLYIEYPCSGMTASQYHDDVIKWKHFPRYWPFVREIHRSPVNSPHKGQWRGTLMFSLICHWIKGWVNNHEAGDLRRHQAHYDVIVMTKFLVSGRQWIWAKFSSRFYNDLFWKVSNVKFYL